MAILSTPIYFMSQNSLQGEFFVLGLRSQNFTEWFLSLRLDILSVWGGQNDFFSIFIFMPDMACY